MVAPYAAQQRVRTFVEASSTKITNAGILTTSISTYLLPAHT
jgi:hypothetical protein